MVGAEASRMGINGPWITKSYLEMILERKGCLLDVVFIVILILPLVWAVIDLSVEILIVWTLGQL